MGLTLTLSFILIFGQALLAQKFNSFYIEPTVGTKLETTKKSNLPPPLQTQYFTITPKQYIGPASIFVGLNFGYSFKNNDKLQLGITQDDSEQGLNAYGISVSSFGPNPLYGQTRFSIYEGVSCTNFSLLYKRSVLNIRSSCFNPDRFVRVYLNFGLSYIYKPNNGIISLTGTEGISFTAPDSSRIEIAVTDYVLPVPFRYSFKFNMGLDFSFGKKDKEQFALNVSFISNRSQYSFFSFDLVEATVTKNNQTTHYAYNVKGTGNGLYFTLSKRLYPIKKYNDWQKKKLEKFKVQS